MKIKKFKKVSIKSLKLKSWKLLSEYVRRRDKAGAGKEERTQAKSRNYLPCAKSPERQRLDRGDKRQVQREEVQVDQIRAAGAEPGHQEVPCYILRYGRGVQEG